MPPTLTWKQMLWTGVVLTVIGLIARTVLLSALDAAWGNGALNNPVLNWAYTLLAGVCFELGLALVAFSLVAREISTRRPAMVASDDADSTHPVRGASASRMRASAVMLWAGVVLVVLGMFLESAPGLLAFSLSGGADVGSRLASDILTVIGPLLMIAFPFGILLVAGSLVVRALEPAPAKTEPVLH